jgi:hypothetical protein
VIDRRLSVCPLELGHNLSGHPSSLSDNDFYAFARLIGSAVSVRNFLDQTIREAGPPRPACSCGASNGERNELQR